MTAVPKTPANDQLLQLRIKWAHDERPLLALHSWQIVPTEPRHHLRRKFWIEDDLAHVVQVA
jgi:hypothetical protein